MNARAATLLSLTLTALSACSDDNRAAALDTDAQATFDVLRSDRQSVDTVTADGDEAAVTGDLGADVARPSDGGGDAPGADGAADASADRPDAGPILCGLREATAAALAVKVATCLHQSPQQALERMYRPDWWEGNPVVRRSCATLQAAALATGCNGVMRDALKLLVADAPGGTCAGPVQGCTMGRFAGTCSNGVQLSDDCESIGGTCVASTTTAVCTRAGDATPCADGAPPRCDGSRFQWCVGGVYVTALDCAATLTTCDVAAEGCVGGGGACAGDATSCVGTQLQQCRGGHYATANCGLRITGTTCQRMAGNAFCGTDATCDPATSPPYGTCEGNTLVLCAGGRSLRFDCRGEGFSGCGATGCTP